MPDATPLGSLGSVVTVLTGEGVRHALVGGLGVSVRGEVRFTRDLDLVVAVDDDARAETLVRRLRALGWSVVAVVEEEATGRRATARFELPSGSVTDLIFATTGIEHDIVNCATAVDLPGAGPVQVASLEHLVAMKVLSSAADRPQDAFDLRGLYAQAPNLDRVGRLLDAITAQGCHRGQDLRAKLASLRRALTPGA